MSVLRQPRETEISTRQEAGVELRKPHGKQSRFGDILPGRPSPAAVLPIPTEHDEIEKLYRLYYEVLGKLRYSEGMALIRAFGYKESTWLMRKYKHRKPRLPEVVLTLNWFRSGKPIISHKRRLTAELLFGDVPNIYMP